MLVLIKMLVTINAQLKIQLDQPRLMHARLANSQPMLSKLAQLQLLLQLLRQQQHQHQHLLRYLIKEEIL